jgi:hypothetical protein
MGKLLEWKAAALILQGAAPMSKALQFVPSHEEPEIFTKCLI